jgi:hypothetical protein
MLRDLPPPATPTELLITEIDSLWLADECSDEERDLLIEEAYEEELGDAMLAIGPARVARDRLRRMREP